jgi:uncharacterized membrane protein (DUF106 family)
MTGRTVLSALSLLFVFSLVMAAQPASGQGGLQVALGSQCVLGSPGMTVTSRVLVSLPGASTTALAALSVVGSYPKDINVTVSPTVGSVPLNATVTMRLANSAGIIGTYQLGVVARLGGDSRIKLFTLHVVPTSQLKTAECSEVGIPLPDSTFLVTITSLGLGLLTQGATRRFVNLDKERKMKAELAAFNKEKKEATLAKDKGRLEKVKKRELSMRQAQSKVQLARTKVTFITIVPLFVIYYLMATLLGGYGAIVAVSPIPIPYLVGPNGEMVVIWWYVLGSFTLSSILSRLLHTTT